MTDHASSQASITFGTNNNFHQAVVRLEHMAGRDIILNHDPHDVTLLRDLNPYLGLKNFTYTDHAIYAGRDALVAATIAQLTTPGAEQSFLLVTGASGSGKSSFVQAGVIAGLIEHYRRAAIAVRWAVLRPSHHPMAALTASLRGLGVAIPLGTIVTPDTWQAHLRSALAPNDIACLVIDQFEEVFGASVDSDQRGAFFAILTSLPAFAASPIHIIATLRSDFLPELFSTPLYVFSKTGINLQAMTSHELRQAIERPTTQLLREIEHRLPELAQRLGPKQWDGAVLERLSADAAQDASYLPLLQVTLQDIWRTGQLKLAAYTTLTAAIQDRAETVWRLRDYDGAQQTPRTDDEQDAIMALLLDLVDVSLDDNARRDVRRSCRTADLIASDPARQALIDDLVKARLLSVSGGDGTGRAERVDIIHESLLRNWDRLSRAIQTQRTTLQRRARFRDDLAQWHASGHLIEGVRLAAALDLDRRGDIVTRSEEARALIERSVAARDAEREERVRQAEAAAETQRRLNLRSRRFAMVAVLLLLLSLGAAGFAVNRQQAAETNAQVAEANAQAAETNARISESQRLAITAQTQPAEYVERGLLLAYEAVRLDDNPDTNTALRIALDRLQWQSITLFGHSDKVYSAAFNHDGTRIVTASADGTARLWDSAGQPIATLSGHTNAVISAVFNHDGTRIVTASDDGTARLWDSAGQPIAMLRGHSDKVSSAAFNHDSSRIVTASADGTARLWDSAGQPIATLLGHSDKVSSAAFNHDGTRIVTASADGTARLWDSTGQPIATLSGHTNAVHSAVFNHDGSQIVTASSDMTARLWDSAGQPIVTLLGHAESVISATFNHNGSRIATVALDNTTRLWATDGRSIASLRSGQIDAAFSSDGMQIITASVDGIARLWNADGQPIVMLRSHTQWINSVAFNHDGSQMVTASDDGTTRLWIKDSRSIPTLFGHTDEVRSATFSSDSSRIMTTSSDGTARLWSNDGQPIATLMGHRKWVTTAAFNNDGSRIVTADVDGIAHVRDSAGQPIATLSGHTGWVYSAAFNHDGSRIVTASFDGTARVWDSAGQPIATLSGHIASVNSGLFNHDGTRIVTASSDGTARVWDSAGQPIATLSGSTDGLTSAAFNHDGSRIVTASFNGTARLWDSAGQPIATLLGHTEWVTRAAFNYDGSRIVTASADGTARLWDSAGQPIATLLGHTGAVYDAAFNHDGSRIITASADGTVRLWDSAGQPIATLLGHTEAIYSAVFSPDGSRIVTASADETARVYLVNSEDLLSVAACRVGRELTAEEKVQFSLPNPRFVLAERQCPPHFSWQK